MSYNNNNDNNSNNTTNNNDSKQLGSTVVHQTSHSKKVLCVNLSEDTLVSLIGDFKVAAGLMINGYVSPVLAC